MMKYEDVMTLVEKYKTEKEKTQYVDRVTESGWIDIDIIYTPCYEELFYDKNEIGLRSKEAKIFQCDCCGEYVGYFDLEDWICDFNTKEFICSECYENEMGADL